MAPSLMANCAATTMGLQVCLWSSDLNSTARHGRAEMFGDIYTVRIDSGPAGLMLTNADAEKNHVSDVVTIVPYRIGGRATYPAVKHEIRVHHSGGTATRYTGTCAPLP